jgi:hypothetical protein
MIMNHISLFANYCALPPPHPSKKEKKKEPTTTTNNNNKYNFPCRMRLNPGNRT